MKLGALQWTRTFGGTGWDDISSIIQTNDGGYIAAGSSIFKLDKNGTLQWCKNISGRGKSIVQTSDGGYTIAGSTNSFGAGNYEILIVRIDSLGNLQWAKTVGGTGLDYGYSITQAADGGFAVVGSAPFNGGLYVYVIKLSSSGNLDWARAIGEGHEEGYFIIQTTDGGYAVAGESFALDSATREPMYVVKLDSTGALQWTSTISLRDGSIAHSITQTSDGGYTVVGYTQYIEGYPDWYIAKLDSTGLLQWSRIVTGIGSTNEAYSIIKTLDGGYAVAGVKNTYEPAGDMYIVKYDSSWNTCGNDSLVTSRYGTWGIVNSVNPTVTSPTGFITQRNPTIGTGGTATMICVTGIQPNSYKVPVSYKLHQNYPNPFNPVTKIRFEIPSNVKRETANVKIVIYDVLGREVTNLIPPLRGGQEGLPAGTYEVDWDGSNYPSGVYFYRLTVFSSAHSKWSDEWSETRKMVLIK